MKRAKVLLGLFAFTLLAACGGGSGTTAAPSVPPSTVAPTTSAPPTTAAPACSPSGTTLSITAKNVRFDKDCLAAPTATAFTIKFSNQDSEQHNVDILDQPGGSSLFDGALVTGVKIVLYKVKGLPAGTFYFHCDTHPQEMNGTFVVSSG